MKHSKEELTALLDYCTPLQAKTIQAIIDEGNFVKAARHLGKDESSVRRMFYKIQSLASMAGYSPKSVQENLPKPKLNTKILFIDIETSPTKAYVWKMWKENIGMNQVVEGSFIMCFCAKWLGDDKIIYSETRTENDKHITEQMINLLDQADIIVAHNADRFDVPKINTSAIKHGINPPSPYKVVDTLRMAKKHFKFERNTLAYLADYLGCAPKLTHGKFAGFELWKECLEGNEEAWAEMMEYNIQDVHTLEEVYIKLRPWMKEHPNVAINEESESILCSKCGSPNLLLNGHTVTDISKFKLFRCKDCGGYSRSRVTEYPKMIRKDLLTTVR